MTAGAFPPPDAPASRVLVAEDEFLVSLALEEDLRTHDYEVVGPFATIADVRVAVAREAFDLALLDINLGGAMIYPVADELLARKIPFLFLSGYASGTLPERYRQHPRLEKPCDPAKLIMAIRQLSQEAVSSA